MAKGAPALIMNSGLMPTLAFYKGKGQAEQQLLNDLMSALVQRLKPTMVPRDFQAFMAMLQSGESRDYLRYTDEALELLKWIRQFVDAVEAREPDGVDASTHCSGARIHRIPYQSDVSGRPTGTQISRLFSQYARR
ncbi:MAG: type III-B CRISPR module-associated protein Cmr5 [Rhodoferax sp.]|nr:type III-B CRISPR module-associated protein Cmr5 [Rhodoferax sp.]